MIKDILDRIFKTQLALKIWYYTFLVTLLVIFVIGIAANHFFERYIAANYVSSAEEETAYVADSLSDNYKDIMRRFVKISVGEDFTASVPKILNGQKEDYTRINNAMQDIFNKYTDMNQLITSAMIANKSGSSPTSFFYSYYTQMDKAITGWDLGFPIQDISGVTILPFSSKPYTNQKTSVPVVIPLNYTTSDGFVLIADSIDSADFVLYLFLGTAEINSFLQLYCNDSMEGTLMLVNETGENISLTPEDKGFSLIQNESVQKSILQSISDQTGYLKADSDYIFTYPVDTMGLYLVNVIPQSLFAAETSQFHVDILWLGLFSILIITCLSLFVSKVVTRPLKKLMHSVNNIENGTYERIAEINSKDEIGQLNHSIDSMYNTIQQQFLAIKKEEAEKYEAKIQVLNEQINPHFIYNALEFINMEIMNENTDNASGMVASLGNYLRSSLAANDMIFIDQELEQIMVYVHIMNYRFNNSIQVNTYVDDRLFNSRILKNILQPMVENSIKYGFSLMVNYCNSVAPLIFISFVVQDEWMVLTVTDNGSGFDPNEVRKSMVEGSKDEKRKHIGLHNIYERLTAFYKTVELEFSSIPFVETSITIKLPVSLFPESSESVT